MRVGAVPGGEEGAEGREGPAVPVDRVIEKV
jgi:hypothetical protein